MPSTPIPARVRERRFALPLLWLLCATLCCPAWAGRPVRVYEVDLKGGQTPAAVQEAMRVVLVRATGRRESASDPALANLLNDASTYVSGYTPVRGGQTQVIFDAAAVERAIVAAGRSVWDRNRPFTLVVINPPPARTAEDVLRAELDRVAIERGLPVTLVPLAVVDAAGNELNRDGFMQQAQRYGGDAVLVGRGDVGTGGGQLQWTLYTNFSNSSWSGSLAAGLNGAVDAMAPAQAGSLAQLETTASVAVSGTATLADYAQVQRLLESVPGVRRVNVSSAAGNAVTFEVLARGGGDAVSHALTGNTHLVRNDAAGAQLVYQYRP